MNNNIIIQDWAGNILFKGDYRDKEVDHVLEANQCRCYDSDGEYCSSCDGTGYIGDFEVYWQDENRRDNVYEFINY